MSVKRKWALVQNKDWGRHLRPDGKRVFWSSQRRAEKRMIEFEQHYEGDDELPYRHPDALPAEDAP